MNLSTTLLSIIAIMFLLQLTIAPFTDMFKFEPTKAFTEPWRFITSMFLHGGFMHIFFNGYALLMFGSILERRMNKNNFLILYFVAGLVGSILYLGTIYAGIAPSVPALGASGAIYGILGALAIFAPEMTIFMMFFPMKMRYAAIFWIILEFVGTFNTSSGIASAAHLGGLAFGLVFAYYLKKKETKHATDPNSFNW